MINKESYYRQRLITYNIYILFFIVQLFFYKFDEIYVTSFLNYFQLLNKTINNINNK